MFSLPLLALASLSAVYAQPVPLPNLPDGWRLGTSGPVVEVFLDLLCSDCQGDWPTMKALVAHYGNKISFIMHNFPLPYHTWGFRCSQGAHVIGSLNTTHRDQAVFDFANVIFQFQDDFFDPSLNQTYVDHHIADLASTHLGYSYADVAAGLADDNLNEAARISWKYSTSRYSTGTPHYMVNGIPVDDQLGNGQLSDWEALIDPLLATPFKPTTPKTLKRFTKDL